MRRLALSLALALAAPLAFAGTPPATAQIDQLLEVTHAQHMVDSILGQVETSQRAMMEKSLHGQTLSPEQQQKVDRMLAILAQRTREALAWDKLRPMYQRVYTASFDAEDIDAMIAFYKSPSGQHVMERMPALVQNTMTEVTDMLVPLLEQFQKDVAKEFPQTAEPGEAPAEPPAPAAK